MNLGVQSALNNSLQTFKTDALWQFNYIIPIALTVLITIALVTFGIKWFMKLAGFHVYDAEVDPLLDDDMFDQETKTIFGTTYMNDEVNDDD